MDKIRKQEIIAKHARHEGDTGSPEVQIALLTERINSLTDHLRTHKKRPPLKKRSFNDGWTKKRFIKLLI